MQNTERLGFLGGRLWGGGGRGLGDCKKALEGKPGHRSEKMHSTGILGKTKQRGVCKKKKPGLCLRKEWPERKWEE